MLSRYPDIEVLNGTTVRELMSRIEWYCSNKHTTSMALVNLDIKALNGEEYSVQEWLEAIQDCMKHECELENDYDK